MVWQRPGLIGSPAGSGRVLGSGSFGQSTAPPHGPAGRPTGPGGGRAEGRAPSPAMSLSLAMKLGSCERLKVRRRCDCGLLRPTGSAAPNPARCRWLWERGRIVLASADRHSAQQVAQSIGVSRPTVWRWQQRFLESGVDGLLRDNPQARQGAHRGGNHGAGGGIDPRFREGRLCAAPPHQATDCTGRAMAPMFARPVAVGHDRR
jgi:hypothetical protein